MTPDSWHAYAAATLAREAGTIYFPVPTDEPWQHAYVTDARFGNQCLTCGQVGAYIHTPPDDR